MNESTTALATTDFDNSLMYAGLGGDAETPLAPSNLRLLQGKDVEDNPGMVAGRFCDMDSNMQFPDVDVSVLQLTKGRVLYPPESSFGAKPLCRSNDALFPIVADGLIRQDGGRGCAKCPKGQWKKINGRSIKPECIETSKALLFQLGTGFLYRFNAKGTANPVLTDLKTTLRKMAVVAKSQGKMIYPFEFTFNLSSTKMKGQKGSWYVPKFKPTGAFTDAEQRAAAERAYRYYVLGEGRNKQEDDDDIAVEDAIGSVVTQGEYVQEVPEYEAA